MRRLVVLLLAVQLAGCGYSTGLTAPGGHDRVAVAIFDNTSNERDLERSFHEELSRSLLRRVEVRLARVESANLVLRGEIVSFGRRGGVRSIENELLESGVQITVRARLERRGPNGPEIVRETTLSGDSGFNFDTPPFNQKGPLFDPHQPPSGHQNAALAGTPEELDARARVLRNLADRIVLELFAPETTP